ncbi:hypothetical protein TNCV_2337471 [Trichonephila clavipes]|nr:hypothetical protein TNCV_2337471 [Trichonephila clavipes]
MTRGTSVHPDNRYYTSARYKNTRDIGDGHRPSLRTSSKLYPFSKLPHHVNGKTLSLDRFSVHQPLNTASLQCYSCCSTREIWVLSFHQQISMWTILNRSPEQSSGPMLLKVDPKERISSIKQMKQHSFLESIDFSAVYNRQYTPLFVPRKNQLNCDPTFELEEMIIEAKPLHKKKKRLSKRNKSRAVLTTQISQDEEMMQTCLNTMQKILFFTTERMNCKILQWLRRKRCKHCDFYSGFSSSKKTLNCPEVNTRFVYGMRQIGKCFSAGFKLCGTLNLPRLSKTAYTNHENKLMLVNSEVSELSMQKAASELLVLHPTKNKMVEF